MKAFSDGIINLCRYDHLDCPKDLSRHNGLGNENSHHFDRKKLKFRKIDLMVTDVSVKHGRANYGLVTVHQSEIFTCSGRFYGMKKP